MKRTLIPSGASSAALAAEVAARAAGDSALTDLLADALGIWRPVTNSVGADINGGEAAGVYYAWATARALQTNTAAGLGSFPINLAEYPDIGDLSPQMRIRGRGMCNATDAGRTVQLRMGRISATAGASNTQLTVTWDGTFTSPTVDLPALLANAAPVSAASDPFDPHTVFTDGVYSLGWEILGGALAANTHIEISNRLEVRWV